MIEEQFRIYTEQLRDGVVETIDETLDPAFLDVHEKELRFPVSVGIKGKAYLADDVLVLCLDVSTEASMPCAICNEQVLVPIEIKGFYHAVPLDEIKSGIFDFREILRETILLEVPLLAECRKGECPERQKLKKFFKNEGLPSAKGDQQEGYRPFADLDLDS